MIGRLRGEFLGSEGSLVTIECGGVGYEVFVPEDLVPHLPAEGERLDLHVRQIVREDLIALYGFPTRAGRRVFDLLLRVTGCGPKVALALIGGVGIEATVRAIASGNAKVLMAASGVGKRVAERIILELSPLMAEEMVSLAIAPGGGGTAIGKPASEDGELVEALMALGYKAAEAERAAAAIDPETTDLDLRIVAALRLLKR